MIIPKNKAMGCTDNMAPLLYPSHPPFQFLAFFVLLFYVLGALLKKPRPKEVGPDKPKSPRRDHHQRRPEIVRDESHQVSHGSQDDHVFQMSGIKARTLFYDLLPMTFKVRQMKT